MGNLLEKIRHNEGLAVFIVLAILLLASCGGDILAPKTTSPTTGEKVTYQVLQLQYDETIRKHDSELAYFRLAAEDIEGQYAQRKQIFELFTTLAAPQVNGILGGAAIISVLGNILLGHDNRRKDTIIKRDRNSA
jgi:hypothetical protein